MKDQKWVYLAIGTVILLMAGGLSYTMVQDTAAKWYIVKVILGLGAAAFVVALPGTINVELPAKVQATGSLAVFVLILFADRLFAPTPTPAQVEAYDRIFVTGQLVAIGADENEGKVNAGVTFSISPQAIVNETGKFTVDNILVPKADRNKSISLTIHKPGYKDFDIDLTDSSGINKEFYTVKKINNEYRINEGAVIKLTKKQNTIANSAYNPFGTAQAN